jgi:hypothetical protein
MVPPANPSQALSAASRPCSMPAANRVHFHTAAEVRQLLAGGPDGDQRLAELVDAKVSDAELGSLTGDEHGEWLRRAARGRRAAVKTTTPRAGGNPG